MPAEFHLFKINKPKFVDPKKGNCLLLLAAWKYLHFLESVMIVGIRPLFGMVQCPDELLHQYFLLENFKTEI